MTRLTIQAYIKKGCFIYDEPVGRELLNFFVRANRSNSAMNL
jgi:hypothetical protein